MQASQPSTMVQSQVGVAVGEGVGVLVGTIAGAPARLGVGEGLENLSEDGSDAARRIVPTVWSAPAEQAVMFAPARQPRVRISTTFTLACAAVPVVRTARIRKQPSRPISLFPIRCRHTGPAAERPNCAKRTSFDSSMRTSLSAASSQAR